MLTGKKILLGISGSIAAYKTPALVRQLLKSGAEVKVIMTPASLDFVSKLTLSTVSKNNVLVNLFDEGTWANHVELGRWADVMLVAPLSCNTLSKMSSGACDNLLLATYLSATVPVILAPAMDEDMWLHKATQYNLQRLADHGCRIIPVEHGELASGLIGEGRMAEPEHIVTFVESFLSPQLKLKGKKALVTAGPTYEAIDPVRFIGNRSSGKMGIAIAEELFNQGADVTLVAGPVTLTTNGFRRIDVRSAEEMYNACISNEFDIAVMAAAVADYAPFQVAEKKMKKSDDDLSLPLKRTKDILSALGKKKKTGQILVGFALETDHEKEEAIRKLRTKNPDFIVMNSLQDVGAGFEHDSNKATLFFQDGREQSFELQSKKSLAKHIVDTIIELL
jgi:phosphopantothenoylcysteine decarboxylase/phosphopantothenate--cysteine ligase